MWRGNFPRVKWTTYVGSFPVKFLDVGLTPPPPPHLLPFAAAQVFGSRLPLRSRLLNASSSTPTASTMLSPPIHLGQPRAARQSTRQPATCPASHVSGQDAGPAGCVVSMS